MERGLDVISDDTLDCRADCFLIFGRDTLYFDAIFIQDADPFAELVCIISYIESIFILNYFDQFPGIGDEFSWKKIFFCTDIFTIIFPAGFILGDIPMKDFDCGQGIHINWRREGGIAHGAFIHRGSLNEVGERDFRFLYLNLFPTERTVEQG